MLNVRPILFPAALLFVASIASADEDLLAMPDSTAWRPVMSLGVGVAHTSNLGTSQFFPILVGADAQYNYQPDGGGENASLADFFVGEERMLSPNWAVQIGGDVNQIATFDAKGTVSQGAPGSLVNHSYQYTVLTREILEENKLLYTINDRYHPYVSLGLGVGFNEAYDFTTSATNPARQYGNQTTTTFAYRTGLGLDMDMNKHVRLGLGYRFTDLGKVSLGSASITSGDPGATSNGTLSQSHLYTNEVLAQFTYVI